MAVRTVTLYVPHEWQAFALQNGAKEKYGEWYCESPVPQPLRQFIRERSAREAKYQPVVPFCPVCNCSMVKRLNNKRGEYFWGCSTFPKCNGTREIDWEATHVFDAALDGLVGFNAESGEADAKVSGQSGTDHSAQCPRCGSAMELHTPQGPNSKYWRCVISPHCDGTRPYKPQGSHGGQRRHPLQGDWERIVLLAANLTGSELAAQKWLETPSKRLGGKTPISMLGSKAGCIAVESVLLGS